MEKLMEMPVGGRRRGAADADAANRREMPARTPPNARARLATHKQNFDDMLNFARNNPCVVAQVLLSLVALASPLHSVWLTLSRATLNTLALVLVLNIVVYLLAHFFISAPAEKKPRRQSTPDMRLAAQTRAASTRQTNTPYWSRS